MRALFVLLLVVALTRAARSFAPDHTAVVGSGAALAFGFILLAALQTGQIFHRLRLPHLTGFLLCGAIFGPELLGFVTTGMLSDLTLVKRVAIGLIAFLAGCELNFRALRPRLRSIGAMSVGGLLCAFVFLFFFFFSISSRLPFLAGMTLSQRAAASLLCANVLCALSPSVVMGLLAETRAAGPLSELSLSIVVLADLAIALSFSLSTAVTGPLFAELARRHSGLTVLLYDVLVSVAVGVGVGLLLTVYIRRIGLRVGLFIFGVLFVVAESAGELHLDPLLIGLSAGLFLENISPISGHEVIQRTEPATMPTFALFFAVIGAELHLHSFVSVIVFGIGAALCRAAGLYLGSLLGGKLAGEEPRIARLVPFGMFPQAGVAVALANLMGESFKPWGEGAKTLILGTVVVNELIGPVLFRGALRRAGELGKRQGEPAGASAATAMEPPAAVVSP